VFIAAQLPQVLVMHDVGRGSQVGSDYGEPPRGDQHLGRAQDAHHDGMSTCVDSSMTGATARPWRRWSG
jgi:hypothetical protein